MNRTSPSPVVRRPLATRAPSPSRNDRRSRTRAQWIEWGLIDIHPDYFPDWVYESLPAMGDFCEAEIQRGLGALTVQQRSLEMQLDHPRITEERRRTFTNIQINQLTPQRSLLLEALHRVRGESWAGQLEICQIVKALLDVFDDLASTDKALEGLDTIQRLFTASDYRDGDVSIERLRAALRQAPALDASTAASRGGSS